MCCSGSGVQKHRRNIRIIPRQYQHLHQWQVRIFNVSEENTKNMAQNLEIYETMVSDHIHTDTTYRDNFDKIKWEILFCDIFLYLSCKVYTIYFPSLLFVDFLIFGKSSELLIWRRLIKEHLMKLLESICVFVGVNKYKYRDLSVWVNALFD